MEDLIKEAVEYVNPKPQQQETIPTKGKAPSKKAEEPQFFDQF